MEKNHEVRDLSTVEGTIAAGLKVALADVVSLRATPERIAAVLTDEALPNYSGGFTQYSEIGLVEFVGVQNTAADKMAAYLAATGSASMIGLVAARKITDIGTLHAALGASGLVGMMDGPMAAAQFLAQQAAGFINLPDTVEAVEEFVLGLLSEAVEESIKGRPDLPSDSVVRL